MSSGSDVPSMRRSESTVTSAGSSSSRHAGQRTRASSVTVTLPVQPSSASSASTAVRVVWSPGSGMGSVTARPYPLAGVQPAGVPG